MTTFSRIVAAVFWLLLLIIAGFMAAAPFWLIRHVQQLLWLGNSVLQNFQSENPTNFIISQAAVGILSILIFGLLFWLTIFNTSRRGVKIRTVHGNSIELDINSIIERLEWHLAKVTDVNCVIPTVKAKGEAVDIRLEVEVLPKVNIPMKTDEVVVVTRDVIEDTIGLTLGKLEVHLRCAPSETNFV